MLNDVVNESEEPITIRSITPLSEPDARVASLEHIRLAPRGPGHPSVVLGDHLSYPPTHREKGGDCLVKEIVAATGYELPPYEQNEEDAVMVSIIRTNGPGKTTFEIGRVTYEQNGDTFYEDVRLEIELRVRDKESPELSREDLPCRDLNHLIPQPPTPYSP